MNTDLKILAVKLWSASVEVGDIAKTLPKLKDGKRRLVFAPTNYLN